MGRRRAAFPRHFPVMTAAPRRRGRREIRVTCHRRTNTLRHPANVARSAATLVPLHRIFDSSAVSAGADQASLRESLSPEEAQRVLRRLEFHFLPKHASWLNMVEIEIGVLRCQCLLVRRDGRQAPSWPSCRYCTPSVQV